MMRLPQPTPKLLGMYEGRASITHQKFLLKLPAHLSLVSIKTHNLKVLISQAKFDGTLLFGILYANSSKKLQEAVKLWKRER